MSIDMTLGHTQRILAAAQRAGLTSPQTAYVLATAKWETAHTMQPVREAYYLGQRAEAYRKGLRYYPWYGRGFVQLTWEANYAKQDRKLGLDGKLMASPDLAMRPDVAADILVRGMQDGDFTGKKLTDYINSSKTDYVGARRIVNGTDKASEIAAIARDYEVAMTAYSPRPPVKSAPAGNSPALAGGVIAAIVALVAAYLGLK